jgi:hypothetical protein
MKWKHRLFFRWMTFTRLPLAWLAGLQLDECSGQRCVCSLRHSRVNQNPFRSIYFAALLMAGEMVGGLPALLYMRKRGYNCAMLVTRIEAEFYKKAVGRIHFHFEEIEALQQAIDAAQSSPQEPSTYLAIAWGFDKSGSRVAEVRALWSFKARTQAAPKAQ